MRPHFRLPVRALARAALAGALYAAPAAAQDRIEPAATLRVVETDNPVTGAIARSMAPDPTPAEILRIQVELARAGFDGGSRSGQLDGPTRRALIDFQTVRGLLVCGCFTYETVVALGIRPLVIASSAGAVASPGRVEHGVTIVDGSAIFVVLPHGRFHRRHRSIGPGVVVGHEPVLGTPPRPLPRSSVGVRDPRPRPPAPLRSGSQIRPGRPLGSGLPGGARRPPPRP